MIEALIFDLDDTLYIEADFIRSGYAAAAREFEEITGSPPNEFLQSVEAIHEKEGRDRVFNKAVRRLGFAETLVPPLIEAFRSHSPDIRLPSENRDLLARLRRKYRLGCVTDGWASVQRRKISALDVESLLDAIVVTDDMGREYWKPHPASLLRCCELLGVPPSSAIFIGDNPERDMLAAKAARVRYIHLETPYGYRWTFPEDQMTMIARISSLAELEERLRVSV